MPERRIIRLHYGNPSIEMPFQFIIQRLVQGDCDTMPRHADP